MCGIVGYWGPRDGRKVLKDGLSRLEYRGYDSAGVALATDEGLAVEKVVGRVGGLEVDRLPPTRQGIAHTRWATHGSPTVPNAHPHLSCDAGVAVVHNGVITNHLDLRTELEAAGHTFNSETDSEVIAHLFEEVYPATDGDLVKATRLTMGRLEGSYAFCLMHTDHPGELVATRQESPLVLGVGDGEAFVASDVVAFLEHTKRAVFLHDGDLLHVKEGAFEVFPENPRAIVVEDVPWDLEEATLAGFPHFMLKEIHEQPRALREALLGRTSPGAFELEGALTLQELSNTTDLHLVACGSSYNASRMATGFFEQALEVPVRVHLASELGQDRPVTGSDPVFLAITQSGETADTLNAIRALRQAGETVVAATNVVGSTITREASAWLPLRAGPELSVAATKSFTSQALVLALMAAQMGHLRDPSGPSAERLEVLREVPHAVQAAVDLGPACQEAAASIAAHDHAFVLGSGPFLPLAMETALKIKEVSYVHAEALATGELKHGPLALVEDGTPALVYAPARHRLDRTLTSMKEVAARGANVVAITDAQDEVEAAGFEAIALDPVPWPANLFSGAVIGQLIAYHAALERGCDVDRPRNLAKSVTVE